MAESEKSQHINARLAEVNKDLGFCKLAFVHYGKDCVAATKNARYMDKTTMDLLTKNIAGDGCLSQLPLAHKKDGRYRIISGHHRIKAAQKAGTPEGLILYVEHIDEDKFRSMQLSHNALVGKDDLSILRAIFDEIEDLELKEFSGVDETFFTECKPPNLPIIKEGDIPFQEMRFQFTPTEQIGVEALLEQLGTKFSPERGDALVMGDFIAFIELQSEIQRRANIKNFTVGFLKMIEICQAWLEAEPDQVKA